MPLHASSLPQRELERAVTEVNPNAVVREKLKPTELRTGSNADVEKQLRRAQDILSQKLGRPASIQDVIAAATKEYVERHDPVRKAERASSRKPRPTVVAKEGRRPIPAPGKHAVALRDRHRCSFTSAAGVRCPSQRWLHFHHQTPVARGGVNVADNLVTLCSAHHRRQHRLGRGP